jgi:hypothetical protein
VAGVWRGNVESVGHLCVLDAQLPCQDAWLKPMTRDDHLSGHSISRCVVCAIYKCNDSQETLDLALQSRVRQCVALDIQLYSIRDADPQPSQPHQVIATGKTVLWLWRGNIDSVEHLCVPDAQHPCQDAWLKPMTPDDHSSGHL